MTFRALHSPKFETQLFSCPGQFPARAHSSCRVRILELHTNSGRYKCLNLGHELKGPRHHLWASAATHDSSQVLLQLCPSPGNAFQVQSKPRSHKHGPERKYLLTPGYPYTHPKGREMWLTISRAPRSTPQSRLE